MVPFFRERDFLLKTDFIGMIRVAIQGVEGCFHEVAARDYFVGEEVISVECDTFDELFEVFTLIKTRKTQGKIPMVLFGKSFWQKAVNFQTLIDADVITERDMDLIKYVDSVDEAFDYIISIIDKKSK